ncbi:hypothetical protein ABT061_15825 [Streptosporangium sp. NPDC002544]|uniref:hypothetical protein n=1 Tax=Streptosporangium sp. NPDC002544 TaxID=3154538 RepID=UPI00331CB65C
MSLRERLQQRARPTATWPLRIDDPAAAKQELEQAETEERIASVGLAEGVEQEAARARVAAARAALAACFEPITLEALPPPEFEALAAEYPPGPDDDAWNKDFPPALFLACVRSELDREEWVSIFASQLSQGEKIAACNAAIQVNLRTPDAGLPKDWMPTPS